jgi:undecaprenyl-diphosphatase
MSKAPQLLLPEKARGRMLLLLFFLLLLYVIVPRIGNLSDSWRVLGGVQPEWVVGSSVLVVYTYLLAAAMYMLLAAKKLRFGTTFGVQVASAFANRLLPAGLGGLTLNVQYLRKSNHTLAQSIAVAGTINLLGLIGHVLLLLAVLIVGGASLMSMHSPFDTHAWVVVLVTAIILTLTMALFNKFRLNAYRLIIEVLAYVTSYRKRLRAFAAALCCSMLLTAAYVGVLYMCLHGLGIELSPLNTFIVFTLGIAAGTITPTPGGLGGTEAGLFAGLVAYQVPSSDALAAVLLFRMLTYWLPLLPGFVLFVSVRKRYI